jgi:prepilin-type N-terminal cleavage/methylation domain-containing protein
MKKNSFTLIEILIALTIFGLIFFFTSSLLNQLSNSKKIIKEKKDAIFIQNKTAELLYEDLLLSTKVQIASKDNFSRIKIQTANSINNLQNPYVFWYVLKKENQLVRAESIKDLNIPISEEKDVYLKPVLLLKKCKIFKVYKKNNKVFAFLKFKNQKPVYFEAIIR